MGTKAAQTKGHTQKPLINIARQRPSADAYAVADLRVEEIEGKAGVHRFDPERDLGQLHRHRVAVHPVQAGASDIGQGMAEDRV